MTQIIRYALCCILATLVCCTDVATTGAGAVYNRHSIKKNISDQYITMQAYQALYFKREDFADTHIVISTFNGETLLNGQVPHKWQKYMAEKIIKKIPEINVVYNLISVENPSSTLTRMSDSWITTKVKSKLIASEDLDASKIKVVTENGAVYLMGVVEPQEADAAVQLTSETDGVQKVVRVFSYMTISKKRA